MRIALALHGNLRTFLMPRREDGARICDLFVRNVVATTNCDVFAFTDSDDFFHDGSQCYLKDKRIETIHNDGFRIYDKVRLVGHDEAKQIISENIKTILGDNLKCLCVEEPFDVSQSPKTKELSAYKGCGGIPVMMVGQYRKIDEAYAMVQGWESASGTTYDAIIKYRFDNAALSPLHPDLCGHDILIPGGKGPIIYDWHAFGTRAAMSQYFSVFGMLGFTMDGGHVRMLECSCGHCLWHGKDEPPTTRCPNCGRTDGGVLMDVTLAPEHHIYRTLMDAGLKWGVSRHTAHPYRYRENANSGFFETVAQLGLGRLSVANHSATDTVVSEYGV